MKLSEFEKTHGLMLYDIQAKAEIIGHRLFGDRFCIERETANGESHTLSFIDEIMDVNRKLLKLYDYVLKLEVSINPETNTNEETSPVKLDEGLLLYRHFSNMKTILNLLSDKVYSIKTCLCCLKDSGDSTEKGELSLYSDIESEILDISDTIHRNLNDIIEELGLDEEERQIGCEKPVE